MPAIDQLDQFWTVAVGAPGWMWVAAAVLLAAVALADDRVEMARRTWGGTPRLLQLALFGAVGGFALGLRYPHAIGGAL